MCGGWRGSVELRTLTAVDGSSGSTPQESTQERLGEQPHYEFRRGRSDSGVPLRQGRMVTLSSVGSQEILKI